MSGLALPARKAQSLGTLKAAKHKQECRARADKRIKGGDTESRTALEKPSMEQVVTNLSAQDHAFELARWYHELAKMCIQAAEHHLALGEDSPLEDVDRALAINEVIRIRMATVQSVERVFRAEFQRLYIDHQVDQILSLGPEAVPSH
jgi:hypothetical protein